MREENLLSRVWIKMVVEGFTKSVMFYKWYRCTYIIIIVLCSTQTRTVSLKNRYYVDVTENIILCDDSNDHDDF